MKREESFIRSYYIKSLVFSFFVTVSSYTGPRNRTLFFYFLLMRYIYLFLAFLVFSFSLDMVSATTSQSIACTMEYAPVCGSIQVQCITAPCYPVRETFGNKCIANAAAATNITIGECGTVVTPPPIGGQKDMYGCLTGAGYNWNHLARQCLRP